MSIYGVGPSNISRTPLQRPPRDGAHAPAQRPLPSVITLPGNGRANTPTAPGNASPQSVPAEPPAGTDPALWSVLSSDERAFFAKAGAMGPLTYGRAFEDMRATQLPASRGGRLDVKV